MTGIDTGTANERGPMDGRIRFTCTNPACGKRLKAPPEHAGRWSRCSCGERVLVPGQDPLPAATAPAAPPSPAPAGGGPDDRHVDWVTRGCGAALIYLGAFFVLMVAFGSFDDDAPGRPAEWTPKKVRGLVQALFAATPPAVALPWAYVAAARRWTRSRVHRGLTIAGGSLVGFFVLGLAVVLPVCPAGARDAASAWCLAAAAVLAVAAGCVASRPRVCSRCEKPVSKRGGAIPAWFDADTVDYRCDRCKAVLCGACATATPTFSDSLQSLKARYRASGPALKRAVDADPQAVFERGELDPICPSCKDYLRTTGRVL